ncbi:Tetratricopeptide TPR_1 repeat-containing protein [Thalassoporum mexicanum PCC 7367]|uniref:tetratricopeptide repeat protein n=1 Tax=Thalassoporum mexicanum TaxID=3457544 RepID=UPI00029F84CC|nr:tetratricopeptide repeat protein [Pseudanabaena sp. PCC 7367]AFY68662.1 Tetratricopeptide TPR_1 repeat-containing protein [Pseudanabaena sp. PCC 7367]
MSDRPDDQSPQPEQDAQANFDLNQANVGNDVNNDINTDQADVANRMNNQATLYSAQGHYELAEPLLQQVLTIRQELYGDEHTHVADSLNNLGALYYNQAKFAEAEPIFQKSLAICEQVLGSDHTYTKITREWLEDTKKELEFRRHMADNPEVAELIERFLGDDDPT